MPLAAQQVHHLARQLEPRLLEVDPPRAADSVVRQFRIRLLYLPTISVELRVSILHWLPTVMWAQYRRRQQESTCWRPCSNRQAHGKIIYMYIHIISNRTACMFKAASPDARVRPRRSEWRIYIYIYIYNMVKAECANARLRPGRGMAAATARRARLRVAGHFCSFLESLLLVLENSRASHHNDVRKQASV